MEQVVKFLKEANTHYSVTVEGGQPRVKTFSSFTHKPKVVKF